MAAFARTRNILKLAVAPNFRRLHFRRYTEAPSSSSSSSKFECPVQAFYNSANVKRVEKCRQYATAATARRQETTNATSVVHEDKPDFGQMRQSCFASIDEFELDLSVRGRVDADRYRQILNQLAKYQFQISSEHALSLLRCCGEAMFAESAEGRLRLLDKAWNLLPLLGIKLATVHFNTLLSIWAENKHRFSVVDFLSRMDEEGESVSPDGTTYQYILMRYCMDGDVNGATTVLEHMKSKGFSINQKIFNALIYCYSKIEDTEGVKNVLETMQSSGVRINSFTYFSKALPFAESGDMAKLKKIYEEGAEGDYSAITQRLHSDDTALSERHCFELVFTLCANGHSSKLAEMLTLLPRQPSSAGFAHQTALRLILIGKFREAYDVACTSVSEPSDDKPNGAYIIYTLVSLKPPIRILYDFFDFLENEKLLERPYDRALYSALRHHYEGAVFELIRLLRDRFQLAPRPAYFYPLIADYAKAGDSVEIVGLLMRLFNEFKFVLEAWEANDFIFRLLSERTTNEFLSTVRQEMIGSNNSRTNQYGQRLIHSYGNYQSTPLPRSEPVSETRKFQPRAPSSENVLEKEDLTPEELEAHIEKMKSSGLNYKAALRRLVVMYSEKKDVAALLKTVKELESLSVELPSLVLHHVLVAATSIADGPKFENLEYAESVLLKQMKSSGAQDIFKMMTELASDGLIKETVYLMKFLERHKPWAVSSFDSKMQQWIGQRIETAVGHLSSANAKDEARSLIESAINANYLKPNTKRVGDSINATIDRRSIRSYGNNQGAPMRRREVVSETRKPQPRAPPSENVLEKVDLTPEELEGHMEKMKSSGLNYKAALRRLVVMYSEKKDVTGLLKTVKELESLSVELPSSVLLNVLVAATSIASGPKCENLEYAESVLLKQIKSIGAQDIFKMMTDLASDGLIKETVYLMKFLERHKPWAVSSSFDSKQRQWFGQRIELAAAHLTSANAKDEAQSLIESAINANYLKPNTKRVGDLINAAIDRNDMVSATNLFVNAASKHGITACVQRLMTELIRRIDAKSLQKVFDNQQNVNGETDAKFRLVMALCNCGKVEQALKVWRAVETRVPMGAVEQEFEFYTDAVAYRNLAKVCRESPNDLLDRNRIYESLFDIYRKRKDWKSAVAAWAEVNGDKKIVPSVELYRLYARILRESNRPIPPEIEFLTIGGNARSNLGTEVGH